MTLSEIEMHDSCYTTLFDKKSIFHFFARNMNLTLDFILVNTKLGVQKAVIPLFKIPFPNLEMKNYIWILSKTFGVIFDGLSTDDTNLID